MTPDVDMSQYVIVTDRLGLRTWRASDIGAMAAINADPRVMEFFPTTQTHEQTVKFVTRMQERFEACGYCYFAVDQLDSGEMIGFTGLLDQDFESPFTPCVDIGWRLSPAAWGQGFATEGARACLNYAHHLLQRNEVFAVAPVVNQGSIAVMKKIGMQWYCDFDHPKLGESPRLQRCSAYRSSRSS